MPAPSQFAGIGCCTYKVVALVRRENEQGVGFVGYRLGIQNIPKVGIVIRQLAEVSRSLTGAEGALSSGRLRHDCRGRRRYRRRRLEYPSKVGDRHSQSLRRGWVEIQLVETGKWNAVIINDAASSTASKRRVYIFKPE